MWLTKDKICSNLCGSLVSSVFVNLQGVALEQFPDKLCIVLRIATVDLLVHLTVSKYRKGERSIRSSESHTQQSGAK